MAMVTMAKCAGACNWFRLAGV